MLYFVKDKRIDEVLYVVEAATEDYACILAAEYVPGRYVAPESFEVVDNIANINLSIDNSLEHVHEIGDTESEMVEL